MNKDIRKENWTRFWASPSKYSCAAGIESDNSEVDTFWNDCASKLNADTKVLDVCTGKGGVISKLIECRLKSGNALASFVGIDISDVKPEKLLVKYKDYKDHIEFHHSTPIDRIPLESNSIDVLTSQYGFEYSLTEASFDEIFRLLKNDGELFFVMHHSQSILLDIAKIEIEHIDYINNQSQFLTYISELIPLFSKLKNPANAKKLNKDKNAIQLRAKFNNESDKLLSLIKESNCPDILRESLEMSNAVFAAATQKGQSAAKNILKKYKFELQDSKVRSQDLIEVGITSQQLKGLEKRFKNYNKESVVSTVLHSDGHIVAWGLHIK